MLRPQRLPAFVFHILVFLEDRLRKATPSYTLKRMWAGQGPEAIPTLSPLPVQCFPTRVTLGVRLSLIPPTGTSLQFRNSSVS